MNGSSPAGSIAYHVSRNGEVSGPFSESELCAGVAKGQFATTDLVHATGQADWQPLEQLLDALKKKPAEEEPEGDEVPAWRSIGKWVWARLRRNLTEQGLATGSVFLLLGLGTLALSRWPILFWAPWLVMAALTGVVLLRRGSKAPGAILLLAVILLPWLLHRYATQLHSPKVQNESAEVRPVETKAPDPNPMLNVAGATPAPPPAVSLPDTTPSPLSAPAVVAARAVPQTAAAPTPVPESLLSKAGKLADAVAPYLNRAKEALPKLSDLGGKSAPDEKSASNDQSAAASFSPDTLQGHDDSIITVKSGAETLGNAFACRVGDKVWLFTNTHILAGSRQLTFTQINGGTLVPGAAEIAQGPDLARLALPKPPVHVFEAVTNFESTVQIGDGVAVFGNNRTGDVAISWRGVVMGVGPDRVEVSAGFSPANSGGPIVHLKSGKVIGIASFRSQVYDEFGIDTKVKGSNLGRHIGFRIDRVLAWDPVNWTEFNAEGDRLEQISRLTEDLFNLYYSVSNQRDPHCNTETLKVAAMEWQQKVSRRSLSAADRTNAGETFLNALRFMTKADINAIDGHLSYPYFRDRLAAEKNVRTRLFQALEAVLEPGAHKAL